ncbi:unnamed protein product, partial [Mesorhabditis belari]|uniref:Ferrochelatase n=1 Tax=Mesorhabditis belari TaxID=2138241 RepID=A0AAF3ECZ4_9BILA
MLRRNDVKTKLFLLYFEQPRSEFYAREHLAERARLFYDVPDRLKGLLNTPFLVNDRVKRCVDRYGKKTSLEETIAKFANNIQERVSTIVPEFGPIDCQSLSYSNEESLRKELNDSLNSETLNRVIFLPLYPHFHGSRTGILLNRVADYLHNKTIQGPSTSDEKDSLRIIAGTSVSFTVSTIHRWSDHPFLTNFWYEQLSKIRQDYDALLFVAPNLKGKHSQLYRQSVWATCERIMAELDFAVPYDLAYFNGWNQWNLPIIDGLSLKARHFSKLLPNEKKVAIVPITSFHSTFDTYSILPDLVDKMEGYSLVQPPEDPSNSTILVNGFAELIKNHLLGRRNAELRLLCNTQSTTRKVFAPR